MVFQKCWPLVFRNKNPIAQLQAGLLYALLGLNAFATERFVAANSPNPAAPYTDWSTAATNIQDAIDVSSDGDQIWVTNGVYQTGGRARSGDITNRVTLDKAIIVQSINGPGLTTIQGSPDPFTTNGPAAVRCAWMTNGATLAGFTLRGGATRNLNPSVNQSMEGGGVLGSSTGAVVSNCVIVANYASYSGAGAFSVTLVSCSISNNQAVGGGAVGAGSGGGAANSTLRNCLLMSNAALQSNGGGAENCKSTDCAFIRNQAAAFGGGADKGTLVNCTLAGNKVGLNGNYGGGAANGSLTNCLVYSNSGSLSFATANYVSCTLVNCDSDPLPPGAGNIDVNPQFLSDSIHLASTSPCIGAGLSTATSGLDLDGQPWASPPAIGCDEWLPPPAIAGQSRATLNGIPPQLQIAINPPAGQGPFNFSWQKDGATLIPDSRINLDTPTNLIVHGFGPGDTGAYQFTVSNSYGMVTSAVIQVTVHCVDAASTLSIAPYSSWGSAAVNIQDAVNVAQSDEFILVTNGVYGSGGAVVSGDLTNRIALTQPITVASMNGAAATFIQGAWDPITTNGPLAVRCAWMADGAVLSGFTLQNGATRAAGDTGKLQSGGGVWAGSTNAVITDCILATNAANSSGAGCFQGQLYRCQLLGNISQAGGGGSFGANLVSCLVRGNVAGSYGGGSYNGNLISCTLVANRARGLSGSGIYLASLGFTVRNCIIVNNPPPSSSPLTTDNWRGISSGVFAYSCTTPLPTGTGNLGVDPELLDGIHPAVNSPCRAAGDASLTNGTDLVGAAWANPPSMGCYEISDSAATGPLAVVLQPGFTYGVVGKPFPIFAGVQGWAARVAWSFGDGSELTNTSPLTVSHTWTNAGDYDVTFTAFNDDYPAGVSTNLQISVVPLASPALSAGGLTGTSFTLTFVGQPQVQYFIETAQSLTPPVNWQPLTSLYSFGGLMSVSDTTATNAIQFYRVRSQ